MPARMQAALARKKAAAAAASAPPAPPAAQPAPKKVTDKNSMAARLERIQKGKGPSDSNPLMGPQSSGSNVKFCKKKGG